jgi:hypothetical protein
MKALIIAMLLALGTAVPSKASGVDEFYRMEPVPQGTFKNIDDIDVVQRPLSSPPIPQPNPKKDYLGQCLEWIYLSILTGAKDATCEIPQGFVTFNKRK